jgi:Nucleotidyltransferase domain
MGKKTLAIGFLGLKHPPMTRATHSPLFVSKELFETRYSGASAIFVAGSVVRGEASTYSDLDLVVVYPKVEVAYRESFYHRDWPVEAFIHDEDSLEYFLRELDPEIGRATLAEMIAEGHEVPQATPFTLKLKEMARSAIETGPPALSAAAIEDRRYHISELIDDLREPKNRSELIASATAVYTELADFYFRGHKSWTGTGKAILRRMKKVDPAFGRRFQESFEDLFINGQSQRVIDLANDILTPHGGFLFEGYRRDVPSTRR